MKRSIAIVSALLALAAASCQGAATQEGYTDITPSELNAMLETKDFFFVNTHIPYEGEIANTDAFIPYNELDRYAAEFPSDKDAKIVLYCRSGRMSSIAAEALAGLGYSNLFNLDGGMIAWEETGLPLTHK